MAGAMYCGSLRGAPKLASAYCNAIKKAACYSAKSVHRRVDATEQAAYFMVRGFHSVRETGLVMANHGRIQTLPFGMLVRPSLCCPPRACD